MRMHLWAQPPVLSLVLWCAITQQHVVLGDNAGTGSVASLKHDETATVFDPIGDLKAQFSKFFSDHQILGQKDVSDSGEAFPSFNEDEGGEPSLLEKLGKFFADFSAGGLPSGEDRKKFDDVFGNMVSATKASRSLVEIKDLFMDFFEESIQHWKTYFQGLDFEHFNPFSLLYYVELMDEVKNPSWKRRKHRFDRQVSIDTIIELHNALYLSQLSYAGKLDTIKDGMRDFMNGTFELIYADIEGLPGEPANFMAVHKESASAKKNYMMTPMGFEIPIEVPLEVLLVVRGTKEIGDMLSDTLLDADDFKDGKSHKGLAKAGRYVKDEHLERLKHLLDASERRKVKLTLVGHSLGAGSAAIAAMLFNEYDWIDATSIGFGCPALLDLPQSEAVKDYVITVITDADVVPRMSGAVMVNTALDVMAYDWTTKGLEDLALTLDWLKIPNKVSIVSWASGLLDLWDRPFFKLVSKERVKQVLYPPGKCIHAFRNGVGFSATYTPCSFFDSIDLSRSMIDDHLIRTGYHRAFVDLLRDSKNDLNADFQHNLVALDV